MQVQSQAPGLHFGSLRHSNGVSQKIAQNPILFTADALSATGQICAISGVGPVSLGFLGLGL